MNYYIDIAATVDAIKADDLMHTVWKGRKDSAVAFAKWLTAATPVAACVGKEGGASDYYIGGKKVAAALAKKEG